MLHRAMHDGLPGFWYWSWVVPAIGAGVEAGCPNRTQHIVPAADARTGHGRCHRGMTMAPEQAASEEQV